MRFCETELSGAYLISLEPHSDDRGSFARCYCSEEFSKHGLEKTFVQANLSENNKAGTVRGMHMQQPPHEEVKLVRAVSGAIFDVIVDARPESPSYLQWFGAELSADNGLAMYVPEGFAHGYQSLSDGSAVHYMVSAFYESGAEIGFRPDDPALGIAWPIPIVYVSEKDANWNLIPSQ